MDVIELVAQTGGTLGLAIFAIVALNKVWELRLEELQRYSEDLKAMNCEMREVIERNTEAFLNMTSRVDVDE